MSNEEHSQELENINTSIGKETKVTIGFMITLITLIVSGMFWIQRSISATNIEMLLMNQRLSTIETSVNNRYNELENKINSTGQDRFYRHEFMAWKALLQAKNPNIDVPKIDS